MLCSGARSRLQHEVRSLNCQPKPQHLDLCFPWIQDTYQKGQHLWNYTSEGSGVQLLFSAQVCGSRFPTLAPQTFLHPTQHRTERYQCSSKGLHCLTDRQVIHGEPTNANVPPKMSDKENAYANASETIAESYKREGSKS